MGRVSGVIGYGIDQKTAPGVSEQVVVEFKYRGDLLQPGRGLEENEQVNDNLVVHHSISVVASKDHREHFMDVLFISWNGKLWKVSNVRVAEPRLILKLGGLYHGPRAIPKVETPVDAGGDTGE